jgi:small subunit ribosomal protein S9
LIRAADIRHEWFLVDASDQVLGRLASDVARVLTGKHRPGWTPHLDAGDFVVVTNAERVRLTGRKEEVKTYRRPQRISRGSQVRRGVGDALEISGADRRGSRPRDAPEDEARTPSVQETEGLSERIAPSPGAAAEAAPADGGVPGESVGGFVAVEIQHRAVGRRKTSVARIRLVPGNGAITVNKRSLDEYFPNNVLKMIIKQPLLSTETAERFDIHVAVTGGGPSGQAGAIRHGISRALIEYNAELRKKLKKDGFLSRDPRMKERKKYGQRGARARFQFSKR